MRPDGLYPAVLDLAGSGVLVLGGGAVALRKLKGLPRGLGRIRVVSPAFSPALRAWARRRGGVELERRTFRTGDLAGCRLLFCCSDSSEANAEAARCARKRGLWVCQAENPSQGDLSVPALARAGGLVLALSTGGSSPALAKALRVHFEGLLKASDLPWFLGRLARRRTRMKSDPATKARLLRRVASPKAVALALKPRSAPGRRRLEALFQP